VPDTFEDVRFINNPLVVQAPFIRFYAGVPIHASNGQVYVVVVVVVVVERFVLNF
jgi:GAF domain-containing protein